MRFRAYDHKKKTKMTVYNEYGSTLLNLRLHFNSVLWIETKANEEQFEEYDPDWLYLKVIKYNESLP